MGEDVKHRTTLVCLCALLACSGETVTENTELEAPTSARSSASTPSSDSQILFGDLHVHTAYSTDSMLWSLPIFEGSGVHPLADACDFARYCSSLDFWSVNDHAESLTPELWTETKKLMRSCNAREGVNPEMVSFLGWEWSQMALSPEENWGHRNVIFRDTADDLVPTRPIAATWTSGRIRGMSLSAIPVDVYQVDPENKDQYALFDSLQEQLSAVPFCPEGVGVRDLPSDCAEVTDTPAGLFEKLEQWGFDSIVIPHGVTWGANTVPGVSWDKTTLGENHNPKYERLVEIYSGHGTGEVYRDWRPVLNDAGRLSCPEPGGEYTPSCWQAGEIIRKRCEAEGKNEPECASRAADARQYYVDAGVSGHATVAPSKAEEWGDSGQCRDCFMPTYEMRPGMSAQYALAFRNFDAPAESSRLRYGFIGSTDNHTARPGAGYKELGRGLMSDNAGFIRNPKIMQALAANPRKPPSTARQIPVQLGGTDPERGGSFFYTGGLVAAHARSQDRGEIFDAIQRSEVYATSGPRILLWFDLLNAPGKKTVPMGSQLDMAETPRFRVRAAGAFVQEPGCPDLAVRGLGAERLQELCLGECYNPTNRRHRIDRIEVVRVRPQIRRGEPMLELIDDPWLTHECAGATDGCIFEFEDPEFAAAGREAVYYVRAIQEPTPAVNGGQLRCERNAAGDCINPKPCYGDIRTAKDDDCLSDIEERAWSSPIFVGQAK